MIEDVDLVEHLAVLELNPGDVLVFTIEDDITVETAERIREMAEEALPDHEVMVLSGGLQLGAVRMPTQEGSNE